MLGRVWGTCFKMASKEKEGDTTIMLTEQDIPGAELPKPPENCTVAILKRWLSFRGAKVSGKRNELIKRSVLLSNNQAKI